MRKVMGRGKGGWLAGSILLLSVVWTLPVQAAKSLEVTQTQLERQAEGEGKAGEADGQTEEEALAVGPGVSAEGGDDASADSGTESGSQAEEAAFSEEELADSQIEYGELEELIRRGNPTVKAAIGSYDTDLEIYQEALSSLAAAKEEMTENAGDLKKEDGSDALIAQYESNADQLGTSIAQMNKTIRRLTGVSGQKSLNQSVNTMVKTAQTLMASYNQMRAQRETAEKQEESARAAYEKTQKMYAAGMATQQELLTAEQSLLSAQISLQSARDSEDSLKRQLAAMIGRNAEGLEIGTLPEPDPSVIDTFQLEEDKKTAITSDESIQALRKSQAGGSAASSLRTQQIEEAKGEKNSTMDALYSDMIAKREAYEAAGQAFQSAQKERDALETKYQSGMISRQDYLQGVASYQEKKADREAASIALSQAISAYRWEIKGI